MIVDVALGVVLGFFLLAVLFAFIVIVFVLLPSGATQQERAWAVRKALLADEERKEAKEKWKKQNPSFWADGVDVRTTAEANEMERERA